MSYKITIEQTREARRTLPRRWEKIGEQEVARAEGYCRATDEPKTRIESVMGYTPEVETVATETVVVLTQTVEALDLPAVIKAINNL